MDSPNETSLRFFTTAEIAEMLKMNVQVIARKLKYGELVGYKIGKDWRVREPDLMAWLERHSNKNMMEPGEKVIRNFQRNGRFPTLPVQRKKRRYILQHILEQFELNRVYDEEEVNLIISRFHDDYCFIRREFICEKMMTRKDGKYMRCGSYIFIR